MKKLQYKAGVVPIIIVILAVVVVGLGYGSHRFFNKKPVPLPALPSTTPLKTLEINFTETGNILNWDSRTESYVKDWILLYEKPGNPAISVKLVFNETSLCDLGKGEKNCNKRELNNGDRAKIEGNKNNGQVVVIKLKRLQ